ncbi:MAG: META domain-containing protein [Reyranella sp.]|uniref:META domain-containing protein n=1 Tax=Reyranella sp. TaxID=1929291 RepID=UPI001AD27C16|nr:META domain-containing protein [Reyranella sp.]MBN9085801.1 META domain-containing protein [Reyranella sp.]
MLRSILVVGLAALSACASPQLPEPPANLAGTSWRLVYFQPSGAGANPVVPPRVGRYTADFGVDGTLALGLDCNRATARWAAIPSGRGALSVTAGAMTRAFCGDGALDSRIAQDLEKIRSFKVEDGRLFLTLDAGAGTYVWRAASGGG